MPILSWLLSEPLAVGESAPDFILEDQDGRSVALADFRGRKNVILIFYPGDDTSICTKQLCEFRDHWQAAQAKNTLVFGVNPQSAESHRKFAEKYHYPFPLLVDTGKKVSAQYHAGGLVVKRTVYLIGESGRIRFARRGKPAPDEVLNTAEWSMKLPRLYPILDTFALETRGFAVVESARTLIAAGVRILQYRHKREFTQDRYDEAARIAEECLAAGTQFVINDRADFARLLNAGLHIGQEDLPPEAARQVLGRERLLGLSTHNEAQLRAGGQSAVDYLALGPIYATISKEKPDPVVGLAELTRLRKLTDKPLVAIGGITIENAGEVLAAGADSVAVISGLLPDSSDSPLLVARIRQWLSATSQ